MSRFITQNSNKYHFNKYKMQEIQPQAPKIKKLSDRLINMIAAGEVVERPMSVIKELVENSLDASSDEIEIHIENGGKNLISIADNGSGIPKDEVHLAFERHATSKIDDDIFAINSFGFRGEALPSIASVSKIKVQSSHLSDSFELNINYGDFTQITPGSRAKGTKIAVCDLFANTPVRMKFMKSTKAEVMACDNLVRRLALANPHVGFKFYVDGKLQFHYIKQTESDARIKEMLGEEFIINSIPINFDDGRITFYGRVSYPTYNKGSSNYIYNFVNGRTLRDKLLQQVVRNAYVNLVPAGRYPEAILFYTLDNREVDVNAHPTKQEIRLVDEKYFRNTVQTSIRQTLKENIDEQNTETSNNLQNAFAANMPKNQPSVTNSHNKSYDRYEQKRSFHTTLNEREKAYDFAQKIHSATSFTPKPLLDEGANHPLGVAKCQIASSFIVAENGDELIIVDQHAAHERINLEKFKGTAVLDKSQTLTVPSILKLTTSQLDFLFESQDLLQKYGIVFARHGADALALRQTNALLDESSTLDLIRTIASDQSEDASIIEERLIYILGNIACKKSLKAGQSLSIEEMNGLLRQIEKTEHSASCNHGRPTYIKLSKAKLASLFERN